MGQFDKFKNFIPGTTNKPSVLEPEAPNKLEGIKGKPGMVIPAQVVGAESEAVDPNGGGAQTSIPITAGTNRKMAFRRADLRTPRSKGGPVFDSSSTLASKDGITGPTADEIEKLSLEHLKELKSTKVETKVIRGQSVTQRVQPKAPEPTSRIIGNPLQGKSHEDLLKTTSMRMDSTGDVYDQDELQVAQGQDISDAMEAQKKLTGDWRVRGPQIEERNAETKPGLDEVRRERKLARKRGSKDTGFSGQFDKNGNPISAQHAGDTGPKHVGERPIVGAKPVTKSLGSVITEESISDSAHDLRASMTEGKEPDILSTTMREHDIEGPEQMTGEYEPVYGNRETAPVVKPEVTKPGNAIPGRVLDTFSNQPVSPTEDAEDRRRAKNRVPGGIRSAQWDPNKMMGRGTRGRKPETVETDTSKLVERNAKLDAQGRGLTMHAPEVMALARHSGANAGLSEADMNTAEFMQSEHVTRAYVEHHSGATKENLNKYLGGRPLEARSRLNEAYQRLNQLERFNATKAPGTGYTYSFDKPTVGQGKVDVDNDYFKSSTGEHVPMSNLSHPEHPLANGGYMEGSHVPFSGFVPRGDGTQHYVQGIHHGWAPYNRNGKRVFEKHNIPEGAVHEAEVLKESIATGTPITALSKQLSGGKETEVTMGGKAITAAPKPGIKGASKVPMPDFTAPAIDSPIEPSAPSVPARSSRALKLAKAHDKHLESNTRKVGCSYCTRLSSRESRENAADIAGTFVPQPPRAGSGSVLVKKPGQEAVERPLTAEETAATQSIPKADDSSIVVSTADATRPKQEPLKFTPPKRG